MLVELEARYDSRKSFYGKAKIHSLPQSPEAVELWSYDTLVATIDTGKVFLHSDWDYSPTTLRHVKEFLKQSGFKAETKAQIARDYKGE